MSGIMRGDSPGIVICEGNGCEVGVLMIHDMNSLFQGHNQEAHKEKFLEIVAWNLFSSHLEFDFLDHRECYETPHRQRIHHLRHVLEFCLSQYVHHHRHRIPDLEERFF